MLALFLILSRLIRSIDFSNYVLKSCQAFILLTNENSVLADGWKGEEMTNTLNSLLAKATHPTTPDNEALNAIRALGRKSKNKTVRIVEGEIAEDNSKDLYFVYEVAAEERAALRIRVGLLESEVEELKGFRAEAANLSNLLAAERVRLNSRIEKLSHDLRQSQDDLRAMSALATSRNAEIETLEREAAVGRQFRSLMALAGSIEPAVAPATDCAPESDSKGGRSNDEQPSHNSGPKRRKASSEASDALAQKVLTYLRHTPDLAGATWPRGADATYHDDIYPYCPFSTSQIADAVGEKNAKVLIALRELVAEGVVHQWPRERISSYGSCALTWTAADPAFDAAYIAYHGEHPITAEAATVETDDGEAVPETVEQNDVTDDDDCSRNTKLVGEALRKAILESLRESKCWKPTSMIAEEMDCSFATAEKHLDALHESNLVDYSYPDDDGLIEEGDLDWIAASSEGSTIDEATELAKSHQKGRPLSVPFSEALRVLMHDYSWSQKRVADTFGVSTGTAFNISNGTYAK